MLAPADSDMPIIRPSTCAGTPTTKVSGTFGPNLSTGHAALTASTFPPIPPEETTTAEPIVVFQNPAPNPNGSSGIIDDQLINRMSELESHDALLCSFLDRVSKDPHHLWSCAPADVKSRDGISMAPSRSVTSLSPTNIVQKPEPSCLDIILHLISRKVHKGLCPLARPVILHLTIKLRGAHPIPHRQLPRILDAHSALIRRIDHENTAERPKGLSAEVVFIFLVKQKHGDLALGKFKCCDEAREASADNDNGLW
ncbi:hypothetical protein HG530_006077 [Fusarium avenaceum]|nr:hypothetical protein HG530_006077 [Fusarium avenaceum]